MTGKSLPWDEWKVTVIEMLEDSAPLGVGDTATYREYHSVGSCASAFVVAAAIAAWKDRKVLAGVSSLLGTCVFLAFIAGMWISLERPPMRTMGRPDCGMSCSYP